MNPITISRDPLGLKPLYYALLDQEFVYSEDLETILTHPSFSPVINEESLNELFTMGPAHSQGKTCFANVHEVPPGHTILYDETGIHDYPHHRFEIKEHTDSYEDTILHVKQLLESSIRSARNIAKNSSEEGRLASLLSGGLDSSYITSMIQDLQPHTFSFEFAENETHFVGNQFQPALDAPYVKKMVEYLSLTHQILSCNSSQLAETLLDSVEAHQLPAMGDIDSSFLFYLGALEGKYDYVFTGECADELFCGYPWYHVSSLESETLFPWSTDLSPRLALLREDFLQKLHPLEYCQEEIKKACAQINLPYEHTPKECEHHKRFYLTIRYFMTTLIDRTNCAAKYHKLTALVPFADTALAEYLFNVPYEMKARNGIRKNLLIECAKGHLPEEILYRRKSPFPKTYDPGYTARICNSFLKLLKSDDPIMEYIDPKKAMDYLSQPMNLSQPWFGQLMCGPQLLAYYLQVNAWLKKYV